jgi:DNA-binding NtrC family response regulator
MREATRVLLVDDEPANLDVLCQLLEADGYRVLLAPNGEVALKTAVRARPDLVLLDVMMPGLDGYEVCHRLKADEATCAIPVIFITARDLHEDVVRGFDIGAVDYITKPFREREVLVRVRTHVELSRLHRELEKKNCELQAEIVQRRQLKGQLSMISRREEEHWGLDGFIGESATLRSIFEGVHLLQESDTISVLVTGESGTGKELIARAIHYGSARRDRPFVPVNCAALPRELADSLFFGHVKGAFTGAVDDRVGYFEMAHQGTLFLDELGEMAPDMQAKLLRILEDNQVRRIGGKDGRKVDVRVLAATNVDLQEKIAEGAFRQDLYYRLARFIVTAPPLRQRRDDIPLLAQHFLRLFAREMGREAPLLAPEALRALETHDFPGNVRELKNAVERALIESGGGVIRPQHLKLAPPVSGGTVTSGLDLPMDIDEAAIAAEIWVVRRALGKVGGNVSEAARLLGTNRNKIYRVLGQEKVD